ncbi:MAG: BolA family transcriptional regulator [Phenylobacterium zucineum]|nr:MAG: BolA family transcriptional regulator [Phenylobacterium zucineum]
MGSMIQTIRFKLTEALAPTRLEVVDDSARHGGHAGARPGGETHFNLVIESASFEGLSKIARQRRVYGILSEELAGSLHALSVKALAPGEG